MKKQEYRNFLIETIGQTESKKVLKLMTGLVLAAVDAQEAVEQGYPKEWAKLKGIAAKHKLLTTSSDPAVIEAAIEKELSRF